nr:hypothetical protein [Tanacetum cinerariifolium]
DVYPVFVDLEISTQADGAQSSRVPVPLSEDPYEAIRQAYLVGTNTESEPFEGEAETPKLPHIVAPPLCHLEESKGSGTSGVRSTSSNSTAPLSLDHPLINTTPALVPILCRTARMAVRVPPAMSPGLSVGIAEVAAMSDSAFRKRFMSFYDSLPSQTLPVRKWYKGTSELILDTDSKKDEEVEESLDSDSKSEDAENEGPTVKDEDPTTRDEGLATGDEGPGVGVESRSLDDESRGLDDEGHSVETDGFGLREEEAAPEGQQLAVLVVGTAVSEPLGLGYEALRHQELALEGDHVYSTFEVGQGSGSVLEPERPERVSASRQPTLTTWTNPKDGMVYIDVPAYPSPAPSAQTPPSPEWSSGSFSIFLAPSIVPSPIPSPMISLTVPSLIASHVATSTATIPVDEDQFIESSQVPKPLPKDPYEVIRQSYLVETNMVSEPFEGPVETKTHESPHTVASHTPLSDSTPPTCHVEESEDSNTSGARSTSSNSTAPLSPDHPLTLFFIDILRGMDVNGMDLIAYLFFSLHWVLNLMVFAYGRMVYVVMGGRRKCFSDTSSVMFMLLTLSEKEDYTVSVVRYQITHKDWFSVTYKISDRQDLKDGLDDEGHGSDDEVRGLDDEGHGLDDEGHRIDDEGYGLDDEGHGLDDEGHGLDDEGHGLDDEDHGLDDEVHGLDDKVHGLDDEGHGLDDEGHVLDDEGLGLDDKGRSVESDGLGLEEDEEEAVHEAKDEGQVHNTCEVGQGSGSVSESERLERVSTLRHPTLTTWIDLEDGRTCVDVPAYPPPAPPVQTPPSPEWSPGLLLVSPAPSDIPSPISLPMISLTLPSHIASPVATLIATILVDEDQFIEIGAQLDIYEGILQDHTQRLDVMPPTLFAEIDRDVKELYTRSLWRPVVALEAWVGHVNTQMTDMSRAGYDDHRLIHDMLV